MGGLKIMQLRRQTQVYYQLCHKYIQSYRFGMLLHAQMDIYMWNAVCNKFGTTPHDFIGVRTGRAMVEDNDWS